MFHNFIGRFKLLYSVFYYEVTKRNMNVMKKKNKNLCRLMLDDMAVAAGWHFPCIIYLREGGSPVGKVGSSMREDRAEWSKAHEPWDDPICSDMCLDVCVEYNAAAGAYHDLPI